VAKWLAALAEMKRQWRINGVIENVSAYNGVAMAAA